MLPHQDINSFHLTLSVILLILTVAPYLLGPGSGLASAYSAADLELKHNSIEVFDIIEVSDIISSRTLFKRSTTEQQELPEKRLKSKHTGSQDHVNEPDAITQETSRDIKFSSLGERFKLVLTRPNQLITPDFNVITIDGNGKATNVPYDRNDLQVFSGHLEGSPDSSWATASFNQRDEKLMTAQIRTGQDTIIVEPTYLHKNDLSSIPDSNITSAFTDPNSKLYYKTMIVYNLRHHKQFKLDNSTDATNNLFIPEKLCASVNVSQYASEVVDGNLGATDDDVFKYYAKSTKISESSRRIRKSIDFITPEQPKERTRCTLHLVADYLFYKNVGSGDRQTTINYLLALINRVNHIYLPTVWETGDANHESISNIGFTVQNITIHEDYTRHSSGDQHYNMPGDKVWGAREFLDNFSRYSPPSHYCLAHLLSYRQFDSPVLGLAYVASARYGTIGGICSPMQQKGNAYYKHNTGISTSKGISGETLITRQADLVLAHELGHNLGAEHDSNECRPAATNGGAYLMHPYAVMGFERNNRFLSNCSRNAIGRVIRKKAPTCFIGVSYNVCGNGVREGDEECDGGDVGHDHSDPCCDSSCRFTPGSQCSDRHSWCCSKCRIVPAGRQCRPAEEFNCKQASYCNGSSAECPDSPPPVEDDRICVGRGLCRRGECIPFCEARDLLSCLCTNPTDACKLCCKPTINGTCVPYDLKGPPLPDGVLCYRGVCEKGRCEQPIQDVVERLWDVIEDINFTTLVKFLRDNIILVVLFISIPVWCLISHLINEFDKQVKLDVVSAILKNHRRHKAPISHSPFLPRLFVGDESTNSEPTNDVSQPLRSNPLLNGNNNNRNEFYSPAGPSPPGLEGEEIAIELTG